MIKPPHNYYVMDDSHGAENNAFAGHGIQGGAHIVEIGISLKNRRWHQNAGNIYALGIWSAPWALENALYNAVSGYAFETRDAIGNSAYVIEKQLFDAEIFTLVYTPAAFYLLLDGQRVMYNTVTPRVPDFTGVNLKVLFPRANAPVRIHDCYFMRFWNYPAGVPPVGWETEIHRRVMNPWGRSTVFDPGGTALKLEYLLDANQNPAGNIIVNSANPGTGDLAIQPVATFANSTKEWRVP